MAERRQIFANEEAQLRRRRQLLSTLVVAGVAVVVAFLTELSPVPGWIGAVAAAVAFVALVAGGRAVTLLGRDDRRRRRDAEAIVDLTGSLLVALDKGGRIRMANPAACAVFARAEADLLGEDIHHAIIAPEERALTRESFRQIIAGEVAASGDRGVRCVERPDATRREVAWHIAPRHDEQGRIAGLLLSGQDVTAERLQEQVRDRERTDLDQLRQLAQEVAASDDARRAVLDRVTALVGATFTGLAEPKADATGDWTYTVATDDWLTGRDVPASRTSGVLAVVRSGEPLFVADALADPRVSAAMVQATGVRSLLFHPVKRGEDVVGVLSAGWTSAAAELDERRAQLLELAAGEAAIALQRVKTQQRLREAALTDVLTGIPNRRAFDGELGRALARAAREAKPVTLAVLDLNEFKALNDRCGHDAGDAVLAACAGAWEATLRAGDMLARLGGDEFAAVLPDCDSSAAENLVTRLRAATPHAPGASIGLATSTGGPASELYQAADRALYRDKEARRAGRLTDPTRLRAVQRTGLLHSGSAEAIEALARTARDQLALPGVFVNLVGARRLRHLSRPGDVEHDSRLVSDSFCELVVTGGRPFVVEDARIHPGVHDHPGVESGLVAYAGIPLTDGHGNVLGAVCAVDDQAREWSQRELHVLDRLAQDVTEALDARRAARHRPDRPAVSAHPR